MAYTVVNYIIYFYENNKYVLKHITSEIIDNFKADNEMIRMIKIFEDK